MRAAVCLILALVLVGVGAAFWAFRPQPVPVVAPVGPKLVWTFEAPRPGSVIATPLVTPSTCYLSAVHVQGFTLSGAVYAIDGATGKRLWAFDRDGEMLPSGSTPLLADGRLFFGEGMHRNFSCKMTCLKPDGAPAWSFDTTDHIEAAPTVGNGLLLFAAGNDGVYALEPATGARKWQFDQGRHIDSTPVVVGGRLYIGCGPSRKHQRSEVLCLDAATGKLLWYTPVALPAWGGPVVSGGRVFVGLGNGRLTQPAAPPETPAGSMVCCDAATGDLRWSYPVGDAIFSTPVVDGDRLFFGARDGQLYALSLDGRPLFQVSLGGPVMAGPVAHGGRVYVVSVGGRLVCIDAADGTELWRHNLARPGAEPEVYASLRMERGRLYVASSMRPGGSTLGIVSLQCFELPSAHN